MAIADAVGEPQNLVLGPRPLPDPSLWEIAEEAVDGLPNLSDAARVGDEVWFIGTTDAPEYETSVLVVDPMTLQVTDELVLENNLWSRSTSTATS